MGAFGKDEGGWLLMQGERCFYLNRSSFSLPQGTWELNPNVGAEIDQEKPGVLKAPQKVKMTQEGPKPASIIVQYDGDGCTVSTASGGIPFEGVGTFIDYGCRRPSGSSYGDRQWGSIINGRPQFTNSTDSKYYIHYNGMCGGGVLACVNDDGDENLYMAKGRSSKPPKSKEWKRVCTSCNGGWRKPRNLTRGKCACSNSKFEK